MSKPFNMLFVVVSMAVSVTQTYLFRSSVASRRTCSWSMSLYAERAKLQNAFTDVLLSESCNPLTYSMARRQLFNTFSFKVIMGWSSADWHIKTSLQKVDNKSGRPSFKKDRVSFSQRGMGWC